MHFLDKGDKFDVSLITDSLPSFCLFPDKVALYLANVLIRTLQVLISLQYLQYNNKFYCMCNQISFQGMNLTLATQIQNFLISGNRKTYALVKTPPMGQNTHNIRIFVCALNDGTNKHAQPFSHAAHDFIFSKNCLIELE